MFNQEEFKVVHQFLESKMLKWKANWYTVYPEEVKDFCNFFQNLPDNDKKRLQDTDGSSNFFKMLFVEIQCWPMSEYLVDPIEIMSLCDAWKKHKRTFQEEPKPGCVGLSTCGWCGPECPAY